MKQALLLSILILSFTAGFSQRAVLSLTKNNVVYCGLPNPIDIAVSGYTCDEVYLTTTNGVLEKTGPCSYNLIPDNSSKLARLTILDTTGIVVEEFEMRVKRIWLTPRLAGQRNRSNITHERLKKFPVLRADLGDMILIDGIRHPIDSFTIKIYTKDSIFLSHKVNGNRITDSIALDVIHNLQDGEYIVYVSDIATHRNCEGVYILNPMVLYLKVQNDIDKKPEHHFTIDSSGYVMRGQVIDICGNEVSKASIKVFASKKTSFRIISDEFGHFTISGIEAGSDLECLVSKTSFFSNAAHLNSIEKDTNIIIVLEQLPPDVSKYPELYFTFNEDSLNDSNLLALSYMAEYLKHNSSFKFQIVAYKDTTESESVLHKRIDFVRNYLLSECIDSNRLRVAYTTLPQRIGDYKYDCDIKTFQQEILLTNKYIESIADPEDREKLRTLNRRIYFLRWDPF